jgi:hypothetical protein
MNVRFLVLIVLFTVGISVRSYAQLLAPLEPRQYAITQTNGFYGKMPLFSVEVAKSIHIHLWKLIDEHTTLFLEFADRTKLRHDNTYQFIYGGQGYLFRIHSFKFLVRKTFTINRYVSEGFKGTFLGGELDLSPGIYKSKYFIAADIYFGDSFKGHVIDNPQLQHVLKGVESGWIKPDLATLKIGANFGYYITENFLIQAHVDYTIIKPHKLLHAPRVYGTIGISYIINRKKVDEKNPKPAVFEDGK